MQTHTNQEDGRGRLKSAARWTQWRPTETEIHTESGPHLLLLPGPPPLLLPLHLGVFDLAHAHAQADGVGGRRLVGRVPAKGQRQ